MTDSIFCAFNLKCTFGNIINLDILNKYFKVFLKKKETLVQKIIRFMLKMTEMITSVKSKN